MLRKIMHLAHRTITRSTFFKYVHEGNQRGTHLGQKTYRVIATRVFRIQHEFFNQLVPKL